MKPEVVVVELQDDGEVLVEVAASTQLKCIAWGLVTVRIADRQAGADAAQPGVFGRAVGVGIFIGVMGPAIAARRRLGEIEFGGTEVEAGV